MTTGRAGGFASTGTEVRNIDPRSIDLTKVQRDWEQALDALLDNWLSITRDQRDEIVDQVRAAVTSDDLAALARLNVSTAAAEAALVEAMTEMALQAARRVVDEAARQDVRIDPVATDTAVFTGVAAALAVLLAQGLTNSAGREALRRWSPSATGDEVSAAVREHLESLSTSFPESYLGGALTAAQNAGRMETMLASPDVALYASEVMDGNTCKFCREVDGRWIGNSTDPDIGAKLAAVYPNGGYVNCEGGVRCRGTVVAVWRPEQVTSVEARVRNHPGHGDQKSHGRKGGSESDLSTLSDGELADKFRQATSGATPDEVALAAVNAEWTRREGPAEGTDTPADREIDRLVVAGQSYRDAYAEVHNMDPARLGREELAAAIDAQRLPGETREKATRRLYAETTQLSYLRAESWTNGHMLSSAGLSAGVSVVSLFSGQRTRARKYASEELKRFWDEAEPRQTYTEFKAGALGRERDKKAAKQIAEQGQEQDFGL